MLVLTFIPALLAAVLLPGTVGAGVYDDLAAGAARAAASAGARTVQVPPFSAGAGAADEARYAAEKTAAALGAAGLTVLDPQPGGISAPRPQALLKGSVYPDGAGFIVTARLVETGSGRLLGAGEARVPARVTELPPVPELDWAAPPVTAPAPSDLRDAMAEEDACSSALKRLRELNAKALDLKARYWAAKLKDPSFSLASLTRNPGSELQDRAARRGFYDLLAGYHAGGRAPLLTAGERQQLEAFMKRENEVLGRCGSR